ncbi:MAG TPA: hypothetical protein VMD09_12750 [Solirubrobacteraceae bacterium]|nr:hypothetical protein [Solirubrobacteraceae bacterium]
MPIAEPTVLDLRNYALRHIGPKAVVWPDTPAQEFTVLNRSDMVARPLPQANIPNSADFASGAWNGRLYDAADGKIVWPNKEASDGVPWRARFDPNSKLQWLEIYVDEYLESCLCVTKVTPDRNQVEVDGYDGFQMCKSAYERDWIVVQSPRDVIERGTQLWTNITSDDFPAGSAVTSSTVTTPTTTWQIHDGETPGPSGGGVTVGPSGGLVMTGSGANGGIWDAYGPRVSTPSNTWYANCGVTANSSNLTSDGAWVGLTVQEEPNNPVDENPTVFYRLLLFLDFAELWYWTAAGGIQVHVATMQIPVATSYALQLESDGEWIWGYVNGQYIGGCRRVVTNVTTLAAEVTLNANITNTTTSVTVNSVILKALSPFLMRGTDKGDYVLPGSASTYPNGGLHARYYNNLDLAGDSQRLLKIHHPSRSQAYFGSGGPGEYYDQQDAQISVQQNPLPGAATSGWSCVWFGAIYLKLSAGNYTMQINTPATTGCAVRVWIGKTQFGTQLVDSWTYSAGSSFFSFTVSASALAGSLSYGSGTVQRDGWYPIKVEYAVDSTARTAPELFFTNSPTAYTDPGGTAIASGAQATTVPATSLSPLGCVDQRYQATSHYDLVQKTAIAFGYQFSVEPKQLESGLFPGVLAPRIREGWDTDVTLEPDDTNRKEGMINYSSTLDGTDQCSSLHGNGAGFQNGNTGQLQGYVYDPPTLQEALFDMEGWQDSADASFLSLLEATLNSQLGLKLTPWQIVAGDPVGRQRLAFAWPLPTNSTVSQFRWRPGDGARLLARDINLQDTSPRQLLVVTRNIQPNGVVSTQVQFAASPELARLKSSSNAMRQGLAAALRPQRNYQRQLVSLTGGWVQQAIGAGSSGPSSFVLNAAQDTIVKARAVITQNTNAVPLDIMINGVDQTSALGGPWTTVPANINLGPAAAADGNGLNLQVKIPGGTGSTVSYQLFVDVLR